MTHDPSNHLIILHRNFVALKRSWHFSFYLTLLSSVFWLLNVVIRAHRVVIRAHRGANLATLLPWIHIRDVYLAVAAKVKNNFWKIIFISLVRNSVKTRFIRKFDRNSNFFKTGVAKLQKFRISCIFLEETVSSFLLRFSVSFFSLYGWIWVDDIPPSAVRTLKRYLFRHQTVKTRTMLSSIFYPNCTPYTKPLDDANYSGISKNYHDQQ